MASYKIAAPDEYLAVTGMGVKTRKSHILFGFQVEANI